VAVDQRVDLSGHRQIRSTVVKDTSRCLQLADFTVFNIDDRFTPFDSLVSETRKSDRKPRKFEVVSALVCIFKVVDDRFTPFHSLVSDTRKSDRKPRKFEVVDDRFTPFQSLVLWS